jgi:hypothetical protein
MKFAVAHNIPALGQIKKHPHFTALANLATGGMKCQGYINEAILFVF